MNAAEIEKEISQTLTKEKVTKLAGLAERTQTFVPELLKLSFHKKPEIAFRAAWILEYVLENFEHAFFPHLSLFLNLYSKQVNKSCQRHFTKMAIHLVASNKTKFPLAELEIDELIETTFEWLISPRTPVAVKANCLDILLHFSKQYNWIKEELRAQTEFLLRDGTAAIQARGKRVLSKLS